MGLGLLVVAVIWHPLSAPAQPLPEDLDALLPTWTPLYTIKTGLGYRDNVLYSDANRQESAFVQAGLELFLSRYPDEWGTMDFFLSFEDNHYLESIDVDREQLGFAQFRWLWELDDENQAEWITEYIYQDQVLDVSVTEADLSILQVTGHTLASLLGLRWDFDPDRWWVKVQLPVERQWFEPPLDDFTEFGTRVVLGRDYGHRSDLQFRYDFNPRAYDTDPALAADGTPVAGTSRFFIQQEARLVWRHHWDASARWRSTTRLSYKRNEDDYAGYFDFNRYGASHEVRFREGAWEVRLEAGALAYRYDVQKSSPPDNDPRRREEWVVRLNVEWALTGWLRAYGLAEQEQTLSNVDLEDYTIHTGVAGLLWEF